MRKIDTAEQMEGVTHIQVGFEAILKASGAHVIFMMPDAYEKDSEEFQEIGTIYDSMVSRVLAQDGSLLSLGTWRILTNEVAAICCNLYEAEED